MKRLRLLRSPFGRIVELSCAMIAVWVLLRWGLSLRTYGVLIGLVLFMAVAVVTFKGRTLLGWIYRRGVYRAQSRRKQHISMIAGNALVWDGTATSMFIALQPQPLQCRTANTIFDLPRVPLEHVIEFLDKDALYVESIKAISHSWGEMEADGYAATYKDANMTRGVYPSAVTVLEVRMKLDAVLGAVHARTTQQGTPDAVAAVARIVSERIDHKLRCYGWNTHVMAPDEVIAFNDAIQNQVNATFRREGWARGEGTPATRSYLASRWSKRAQAAWFDTSADHVLVVAQITRQRNSAAFTTLVTHVARRGQRLDPSRKAALDVATSQQASVLMNTLPMARDTPLTVGRTLPVNPSSMGAIHIPAVGAGCFIGTSDGSSLYLDLATPGGVLYVEGPGWLSRLLVLRQSSQGTSTNVTLTDTGWSDFVTRRGSEHLSYHGSTKAALIVCDPDTFTGRSSTANTIVVLPPRATAPGDAAVVLRATTTGFELCHTRGAHSTITPVMIGATSDEHHIVMGYVA